MKKRIVVGCTNSVEIAKSIARKSRCLFSELNVQKFPDGELKTKYDIDVKGKDIILVQTLHPVNEQLIELIFAMENAKSLGANSVTLIVPYMAYLRQDKRFHPGEALSNHIIAKILSRADKVITIDPHLHRINSLNEIFSCKTKTLSADGVLSEFIHKKYPEAIIIGPDGESYQWAEDIGKRIGQQAIVLKKKRYNSRNVKIVMNKEIDIKGKTVVIVDDIISSGHTMIETIKDAKKLHAKKIVCLGVHGIFAENALHKMRREGAIVHSTNTIPSSASDMDVSKLISDSLND